MCCFCGCFPSDSQSGRAARPQHGSEREGSKQRRDKGREGKRDVGVEAFDPQVICTQEHERLHSITALRSLQPFSFIFAAEKTHQCCCHNISDSQAAHTLTEAIQFWLHFWIFFFVHLFTFETYLKHTACVYMNIQTNKHSQHTICKGSKPQQNNHLRWGSVEACSPGLGFALPLSDRWWGLKEGKSTGDSEWFKIRICSMNHTGRHLFPNTFVSR